MATVGIWKIQSNLKQVIKYINDSEKITDEEQDDLVKTLNYISNDFKTEKKMYVDGINCNVETAFKEMMATKKLFRKENGILGFHAYQSFKEGEVTPEEAHKIGVELANEVWGDRFQVLVATHLNTNHYHNHFVINSVSFIDGKKYYDNRSSYAELRRLNDLICKEHGLSYLNEKKTKSGINYYNYQKGNNKKSNYYSETKKSIDFAISKATSYKEFLEILDNMNYEVKNRYDKLSVRDRNYRRNIRIERYYGDDYSIKHIKMRIVHEYLPIDNRYFNHSTHVEDVIFKLCKNNHRDILARYIKYLKLLNNYPKYIKKRKLSSELRTDIRKMDEYSKQAIFLADNKIETEEELFNYLENIESKLDSKIKEKDRLRISHQNIPIELKNDIQFLREKLKMVEDIKYRNEEIDDSLNKIEKREERYNESIRRCR